MPPAPRSPETPAPRQAPHGLQALDLATLRSPASPRHTRQWSIHDGDSFTKNVLSGLPTSPEERRLVSDAEENPGDRQERRVRSKFMSAAASLRSFWLLDGRRQGGLTSFSRAKQGVRKKSLTPEASPRESTARECISGDTSMASTARDMEMEVGHPPISVTEPAFLQELDLASPPAPSHQEAAGIAEVPSEVGDGVSGEGVSVRETVRQGTVRTLLPALARARGARANQKAEPPKSTSAEKAEKVEAPKSTSSAAGGEMSSVADKTPPPLLPRSVIDGLKDRSLHPVTSWLENGGNLDALDQNGATALHYAAIFNYEAGMEALLRGQLSSIDARQPLTGATALMLACIPGNDSAIGVAGRLLAAGADPNASDIDGHTPLMLASKAGLTPLARRLLDQGARTDLRDASGRTAVVYATQNGHRGLAMVLRRHEKVNDKGGGASVAASKGAEERATKSSGVKAEDKVEGKAAEKEQLPPDGQAAEPAAASGAGAPKSTTLKPRRGKKNRGTASRI